jgi:5-methylcytosine-specific restriction endonuclease McrA
VSTLPRRCLGCGTKIPAGSRCPLCTRRSSTAGRGLGAAWQRLARQVIEEQPWCTWCGATTDLTADHLVPRAQGGRNVRSNVVTACRTCNSSRGGRLSSDPSAARDPLPAQLSVTDLGVA